MPCHAAPRLQGHALGLAPWSAAAASAAAGGPAKPLPPSSLPAPSRLIAIGDVHGDFKQAVRALRLAGLVDERLRWAGGDTVLVQVGRRQGEGPCRAAWISCCADDVQCDAAASGWGAGGRGARLDRGSNDELPVPLLLRFDLPCCHVPCRG